MATVAEHPAPIPRAVQQPCGISRLHSALAVAVLVLSLLVLGVEAAGSPFEADESDYVATSRYFGYLFLQGDVARKEWDSNHWTRTQPPLTRYIVGAWLTARGYDLEKLNQPYVSTASSFEINRQKGRVPTDDVLASARQPMILLGAGSIALLFLLGAVLGVPVGLLTAALALSSPFIRYTLVHVWAEAPLAFFMVLSALLAAHGVRRMVHGGSVVGWGLALGVALGLASATKLTGLVAVALVVGAGTLMSAWNSRHAGRDAARRVIAWAALATVIAVVLFVAVNPFLWRGPVAGLQGMVQERREEMAFQQDQWPEYAVLGWAERPWLTVAGSLQVGPLAESPAAALVLLPFLAVGLVGLGVQLRAAGLVSPFGMLAVWLLGYFLAIVAGLGLKYPRYFMPTTVLAMPVVALGLALVGQAIWRRVQRQIA